MRVTIPDAIADQYTAFAASQGRPVEDLCAAQLTRFAKLEPGKRAVALGVAHLEAIEAMTGGLPLRSGDDVQARVESLAAITFQHVRLGFTPSQLAEIAHRAERQGKPAPQLIEEMCQAVLRDFFWASGGGEAATDAALPVPATA